MYLCSSCVGPSFLLLIVCFVFRAYAERLLSNPRVTLHMLRYYIRSFIHERMISIQAVKVHSLNEKKM